MNGKIKQAIVLIMIISIVMCNAVAAFDGSDIPNSTHADLVKNRGADLNQVIRGAIAVVIIVGVSYVGLMILMKVVGIVLDTGRNAWSSLFR